MKWESNFLQNLITVSILFALFILAYCKWTGKTLLDLFRGLKETIFGGGDEVYEQVQGGFESIK